MVFRCSNVILKRIAFLVIAFGFFYTLSSCQRSQKANLLFDCGLNLHDSYGLCAHIGGRNLENEEREKIVSNISHLGVNMVRTDLYWNGIQKTHHDRMNFSHLDNMFHSLRRHNLKSLSILDYSLPEFPDIWNYPVEWGHYVSSVVGRYAGIVDYWEIWNEENHPSFWCGLPSSEEYLKVLKKASSIIRNSDANSTVLMGGMAGMDINYLDSILCSGGGAYFDIINFHYYPNVKPEMLIVQLQILKKVLDKYNCRKKVWLTETGFSTFPNKQIKLKNQVSEEEQALYLPRLFFIAYSYGVEKVFWYCHKTEEMDERNREHFFGIVHKDLTPKKAYYAFKTLIKMLPDGSTRPVLKQEGNVFSCSWTTPEHVQVKTYWSMDGDEVVNLGKGKYFDIYGREIDGNEVRLSDSLIYVVDYECN